MAMQPLKPNSMIDIPDGEFLHYSDNVKGKRYADNYFVAKKITNPERGLHYKIYYAYIPVESGKKLPIDYTDWPSYFIVDPGRGILIEISNQYDVNSVREKKDLIYYHQRYDPDKGILDFNIKTIEKGVTKENAASLKLGSLYPFWNQLPFTFYSMRILDTSTGGALSNAD